ncbi:MAG: hypothetical protein ILO34_08855 [Kiritimatiellae bacterium]|nr:hypothetical protein [Kiritimatiellia bacterium]
MKKIHFIGIGGVGMAALAYLLKSEGFEVSGCDIASSARTRWLEENGIKVDTGHSAEHVCDADMVIATPAVRRDNPEYIAAGGRLRWRGEVLAEYASSRETIAVCGSHGKTTTATFIAKLLKALGEDVAWAIGGETGDFPVAGAGSGVLVVEADESDGTLALYKAKTLVVTNCEYDHADHFRTPEEYRACYEKAEAAAGEVVRGGIYTDPRDNMKTAIEVAKRRGHPIEKIMELAPEIARKLPDRRFERLADGVYTDYAHHPTEMKCAISMARKECKGVLRVLFQPHRHSRTKALLNDFPAAFEGADEVVLCPVYAAFESPVEGGDSADLYKACRERGQNVFLARSCEEAWEHARNSSSPGDLVLLLGAGTIDRCPSLPERGKRRIFIGSGSNMWKSDLKLSVEYAATEGPAGRPGASLGIPWMAGIPGTIGGWVKMNAGAFGHSISEAIERVKVDGKWIDAVDCGFSYRSSNIAGEIQDVETRPVKSEGDEAYYLSRRRRFPSGTKGSVFKNPPGDFAGRLLEAAGAKGLSVGGCRVWEEHANVIVSSVGARASDFLALARIMHNLVFHRFGVDLVPEVCGLDVS